MAYTEDKKSTGLDVLTTLASGDLHIVGDVSDSGRAKAITEDNLETTIANSTNFVDQLVANNYFTSELANDSNFLTELTTNSTFQTAVNSFVTVSGGSGGGGGTKLAIDTTAFTHTGDTTETTAYTVAIPAGTLGTNNAIRFYLLGSSDGNSADVTYRVKYGASTVASIVDTSGTNADIILDGTITADSLTNAQISSARFIKAGNVSQSTDGTDSTEDSTTALNLVVTIQNASAGATTSFKGIIVESISSLADGVSFIATANEDLTAGQAVGVAMDYTGVARANNYTYTQAHGFTNSIKYIRSVSIDTDKFVIAYIDNVTNDLNVAVVQETGTSYTSPFTFGTPVTVKSSYTIRSIIGTFDSSTYSWNFDITKLDTGKFVVAYSDAGDNNVYAVAGSVSGTTITLGTPLANIITTSSSNIVDICADQLDTDKFAVVANGQDATNGVKVVVGTVSTLTITVGTAVSTDNTIRGSNVYLCKVDATTLLMHGFNYDAGGSGSVAQAGTISGTAITLGSITTINPLGTLGTNNAKFGCYHVGSGNVLFTRTVSPGGSTSGGISKATVSGSTISSVTLNTDNYPYNIGYTNGSYLIASHSVGANRYTKFDSSGVGVQYGAIAATTTSNGQFIRLHPKSISINLGVTTASANLTGFVQGMSGVYTGYVTSAVSKGANATVTIKGQIGDQSSLIPGAFYTVGTAGALSKTFTKGLDTVTALTATDIII